jgi:hypothetical protein
MGFPMIPISGQSNLAGRSLHSKYLSIRKLKVKMELIFISTLSVPFLGYQAAPLTAGSRSLHSFIHSFIYSFIHSFIHSKSVFVPPFLSQNPALLISLSFDFVYLSLYRFFYSMVLSDIITAHFDPLYVILF